jgi:signal transduction histidine kinase
MPRRWLAICRTLPRPRWVVSDTGAGYDVEAVRQGMGMSSMEERIRLLRGKVEWASQPGRGSRMSAWVPVQREP